MTDNVTLLIAGRKIEHFVSYSIESDLYQAADPFRLELVDPDVRITTGDRCQIQINGQTELTGIIDIVHRSGDKTSRTLTVEGRDLAGLLVDSCCEQFVTVQGKTVKQLAEMLLVNVPFINRKQVQYQENIVGRLKGKKQTTSTPLVAFMDTPQKLAQIEPGMSIFEVLAIYAASRGLLFYTLADGTLVFGRPKAKGEPLFDIILRTDGQGNNVERWDDTDDISRSYSRVTVITQSQGHDDFGMDTGKVNAKSTATDPDFPFVKPFVVKLNNDSQTPSLHARMLLEKQRHDRLHLEYTLAGHSQNGRNYCINELARVDDQVNDRTGSWLVYKRVFEKSKAGTCTRLSVGPPGLVAAV